MKQLYCIHSSDAKWVTREREALVDELLPRDLRDENLQEFYSTAGGLLHLQDILPGLLGELAIIPFFAESRRVIVVHNLADFLVPKRTAQKSKKPSEGAPRDSKKRSPVKALAAFVEQDLPASGNVLIFSNIIEYDRGQDLDKKSPIYNLVKKSPLGEVLSPGHYEQKPLFQMSDALLRRDAPACIRHFRAVLSRDTQTAIFYELLRNIRLLIQANILTKVEAKGTDLQTIEIKYLPRDKRLNFYKQAPFVRKKILGHLDNFNLRELMGALERLLEINAVLYPSQSDAYVPDIQLLFETFLVQLCEGNRQVRQAL